MNRHFILIAIFDGFLRQSSLVRVKFVTGKIKYSYFVEHALYKVCLRKPLLVVGCSHVR